MTAAPATLTERKTAFEVRDPERVIAFLGKHPTLIGWVNEAIPLIRQKFGEDVGFALEIFNDGDEPELDTLFLSVITNLPVRQSLEKERELLFDWMFKIADPEMVNLVITIESPRRQNGAV